ncbi:MAG: GntR family transcriptional regulator [Myxococcaceae bacterium]
MAMGTRLVSDYAADQAEREIAKWILIGKYRAGDKLPALPVLAEELGVSFPTLSKALGRLKTRRLVSFVPGEGVFVQSIIECVGLDMLHAMITYCDEGWRRWMLLCQFYDFIRPLLVDWAERSALKGTPDHLQWITHYTLALEDRVNRKATREDIGTTEYELARVLAAGGGNICCTMTINPLFDLYASDVLVKGQETIVPPEAYRAMLNALYARDGKRAGEILEAALWQRELACIAELRKLGWSATGDRLEGEINDESVAG